MMEIKMLKKVDLEGATFVEGFPGIGLVGPMSISYMIDKLEMEYVGYMEGSNFPPLISIHKGEPMPPIRLYYSSENKIVTIFAEFAMPLDLVTGGRRHGLRLHKEEQDKDDILDRRDTDGYPERPGQPEEAMSSAYARRSRLRPRCRRRA